MTGTVTVGKKPQLRYVPPNALPCPRSKTWQFLTRPFPMASLIPAVEYPRSGGHFSSVLEASVLGGESELHNMLRAVRRSNKEESTLLCRG